MPDQSFKKDQGNKKIAEETRWACPNNMINLEKHPHPKSPLNDGIWISVATCKSSGQQAHSSKSKLASAILDSRGENSPHASPEDDAETYFINTIYTSKTHTLASYQEADGLEPIDRGLR